MKCLKSVTALLLALALLFGTALAETKATVKLKYSDGSLRLRAGAGTSYATNGYLRDGDEIVILSEGKTWSKVRCVRTGRSGYINTCYIVKSSGKQTDSGTTVYISESGGSLRVRAGAGTNYSIRGYVQHGDAITVLASSGEWSKIKVDSSGITGYIKTKYILEGDPGASDDPWDDDWWEDDPWWDDEEEEEEADWDTSVYDPGTVTTKYSTSVVNVRSGAGTGYSKVGSVKSGAQVKIVGSSGNWYKIAAQSVSGYISKNYVTVGRSAKTTTRLNVRTKPSSSSSLVTTLSSGAKLTVMSVDGNWANVRYSGSKTGYVSMNYLKFI